MANFFVSYDLNGDEPTHEEMDEHITSISAARGRVLETVWYVAYEGSAAELRDQIKSILRKEDLLLIIEAKNAAWTSLLVNSDSLIEAWKANA